MSRISEMPLANPFGGTEYIEIIQNGVNKRLMLSAMYVVGKSAYELAVTHGFVGSEAEWLDSLPGKSAYEIAQALGFAGTEAEWLESLRGKSAYEIAQQFGFVGTEVEWLLSLKGEPGLQGLDGAFSAPLTKVITTTTYTLTPDDIGYMLEFDSATDVTVTLNTQATTAWPARSWFHLCKLGVGRVLVVGENGTVDIRKPSQFNANIADTDGVATLMRRSGTDYWRLYGLLELTGGA